MDGLYTIHWWKNWGYSSSSSSISSMSWGRALGTHWQDATHLAGGEVGGWIPNQVFWMVFSKDQGPFKAGLDSAWRILMNWNWWNYMYIYILYIVSCVLKSERMAFWGISSSTTWRLTIKIMKVTETKASWTHEGLVLSRKNTWVHHISSLVHPQIHHESMMNPSWNWAKIWAPPGESPTVAGCPSSHGGGGRQSPRGAEARAEAAPAKRGFCTFRWKVKYGSLGNSWTKWL